jgi:hypothetical protein
MFAVVLLIGIGCHPASVLASTRDEAVTLSYLRADFLALKEVKANMPKARLAMMRFVTRTVSECPSVADAADPGQSLDEFSEEALDVVSIASERPFRAAAVALARSIGDLHWRSRNLTVLVRAYAAELRATHTQPPICSELKEWAATGYGAPPQSTTSFLAKEASQGAPEEQILALLAPGVRRHAKTLLQNVKRLELHNATELLAAGIPIVRRLEEGLGFSPTGAPGQLSVRLRSALPARGSACAACGRRASSR